MIENTTIVGSGESGVDTHAHIFSQDLKFIRAGEGYIPDYDAPLGTYLAKLQNHGLTHSVLIQPSFLGTDNSHLLRAAQQHRDQLRCIVITDPSASLEELRDLKNQGAVGTRVIAFGDFRPDFADRVWLDYLDRIAELDWIVEIYCPASQLRQFAEPFIDRGCRLLIDHYGRPDPQLGLLDPGFEYLLSLAQTGKIWVDISGPYRNGEGALGEEVSAAYLASLRKWFGSERILWGSDWPCVQFEPWNNFESSCAFLKRVVPNREDRAKILWETPAKLFGFN